MAIQPDNLNVTRLVNIGLIAIFLSLAISYLSAGAYHRLDHELTVEQIVQDRIEATHALKAEQLAAIDPAGEMTLAEAEAKVIEANRP